MRALGNQPIWANGQRDTSNTFQVNGVDSTNLFNGKSSSGDSSQRYNFNIGSAPTAGGSFSVGTSVYGSNGNSLPSPPPEFMQELRVNASMYDAQQGATSGAQIDVNTSTGTNNWHGQLYGAYANNLTECFALLLQSGLSTDTSRELACFRKSLVNPWLRRCDRWNHRRVVRSRRTSSSCSSPTSAASMKIRQPASRSSTCPAV